MAVEQLAGAADERPADTVFVAARRLADEHDPRAGRAVGEDELGRRRLQPAAVKALQFGAQVVERRRRRPLARRARCVVGRDRRRRRSRVS